MSSLLPPSAIVEASYSLSCSHLTHSSPSKSVQLHTEQTHAYKHLILPVRCSNCLAVQNLQVHLQILKISHLYVGIEDKVAMWHHKYRLEGALIFAFGSDSAPSEGGINDVPYCQYSFNSGETTLVDCVLIVPSTYNGKQQPLPCTCIYLF